MRSTLFAFSALFAFVICSIPEVPAGNSVSFEAPVNTPATLIKRGSRGHSHRRKKGKGGKGGKGGKDDGKADEGSKPKDTGDIFSSFSKTIESLPKALNPAISNLKLPSASK